MKWVGFLRLVRGFGGVIASQIMEWAKRTYRLPALLIEEIADARRIIGQSLRRFFETCIDRLPEDAIELARVMQSRPGRHAHAWGTRMKELSVSFDPKYLARIENLANRMRVSDADVVRAALGDYVRGLPGSAGALENFSSELVWLGELPSLIRFSEKEVFNFSLVNGAKVRLLDHGILYLSMVRPVWEYGTSPVSENCAHLLWGLKKVSHAPIFVHRRHIDAFVDVLVEKLSKPPWTDPIDGLKLDGLKRHGEHMTASEADRQREVWSILHKKIRGIEDSRIRVIDTTAEDIAEAAQLPATIPFISRIIIAGARREGGKDLMIASASEFADHARESGQTVWQPGDVREIAKNAKVWKGGFFHPK